MNHWVFSAVQIIMAVALLSIAFFEKPATVTIPFGVSNQYFFKKNNKTHILFLLTSQNCSLCKKKRLHKF